LALGNPILQLNNLHNGRLGRPASIPHGLVEVKSSLNVALLLAEKECLEAKENERGWTGVHGG